MVEQIVYDHDFQLANVFMTSGSTVMICGMDATSYDESTTFVSFLGAIRIISYSNLVISNVRIRSNKPMSRFEVMSLYRYTTSFRVAEFSSFVIVNVHAVVRVANSNLPPYLIFSLQGNSPPVVSNRSMFRIADSSFDVRKAAGITSDNWRIVDQSLFIVEKTLLNTYTVVSESSPDRITAGFSFGSFHVSTKSVLKFFDVNVVGWVTGANRHINRIDGIDIFGVRGIVNGDNSSAILFDVRGTGRKTSSIFKFHTSQGGRVISKCTSLPRLTTRCSKKESLCSLEGHCFPPLAISATWRNTSGEEECVCKCLVGATLKTEDVVSRGGRTCFPLLASGYSTGSGYQPPAQPQAHITHSPSVTVATQSTSYSLVTVSRSSTIQHSHSRSLLSASGSETFTAVSASRSLSRTISVPPRNSDETGDQDGAAL